MTAFLTQFQAGSAETNQVETLRLNHKPSEQLTQPISERASNYKFMSNTLFQYKPCHAKGELAYNGVAVAKNKGHVRKLSTKIVEIKMQLLSSSQKP